mgnify:FL=1
MDKQTVFFSGKARPIEGITVEKLYGILTVGVEVDMETGVILAGDCTLSTDVANSFFSRIVTGYNLSKGIDPLLETIRHRYHGEVVKALGAALRSIYRDFNNYKRAQQMIKK